MKLERLELKGLLRFRDPVSLDLREMSGLIAVTGGNGQGKTTLMEATPGALYRELPSRHEHELFEYAHDRDSYILVDFSIEGRGMFSARLSLDAVGRKSAAVLMQIGADGIATFLNDGKVSSYDAAIRELLPAKDLVLASAFSAQNRRGSFVTLDKRGRKELFAELLGLSHYEDMAQTSRTAVGMVEQAIGRMTARREVLARDCGPARVADLERQARELAERRVALEDAQERISVRIGLAEADLAAAVERAQEAQRLQEQYRAALAAVQQIERTIADADGEWHRVGQTRERELRDFQTRLAEKIADLQRRIANNQGLKDRAPAIRTAADEIVSLEYQVAHFRSVELNQRNLLAATQTRLRQVEAEIAVMRQHEAELRRALDDAQTVVPCGGAATFPTCQFLARAVAAQAVIPDLQSKVAPLAEHQAERDRLVDAATSCQRQIDVAVNAVRHWTTELTEARETAKDLPRLEASEARLAELEASIHAVDRDADEQRAAIHRRAEEQHARVAAGLERLRTAQQSGEAAVQRLRADLEPLAGADTARVNAAADLRRAQQDQQQIVAQLAACGAHADAIAKAHADLASRQEELTRVEASIARLQSELIEWQTLVKALGRDGLPTLETDAAGPTVAGYCNELLEASFGGRFRVDLVTQVAKADGKGVKEAFDLHVLDNERGGEARRIEDLSGGEQIIVDECLKSALAIYANRRSQAPTRTCWRDETTGPLDPDNQARYLAMLRKLQQLAGFDLILFVTHSADAAVTADAQIYVHDGTAEILLPPYTEARAA